MRNPRGDEPGHKVTAYSGCSYADAPVDFEFSGERHLVEEILEGRYEEDENLPGVIRKVWRVRDRGGSEFRLTYYRSSDHWDIEPL